MAQNALGLRALTNLSTQLKTTDRAFANGVRANLRRGVKSAGDEVLQKVREGASWSSRIPGATNLSIRYNATAASIRIQTNHNTAPHARPYELGNKNQFFVETTKVNGRRTASKAAYAAARKSGAFSRNLRHPVFHKVGEPGGYADVPTRPFFFPAIAESKRGIDLRMEQVVIQTCRDAGFK